MLNSKTLVWFCCLAVATVLILGQQMTAWAGDSQNSFINNEDLSSNLQQSPTAQNSEETTYTLHPLATSSQDEPNAGQSYLGLNADQALRITFSTKGLDVSAQPRGDLEWRLGMKLEGYTREGSATAASPMIATSTVVDNNRIEYLYGDVSEWYINSAEGLKQGFTLKQPPGAQGTTGLLQVRLQILDSLIPSLNSGGQAIDFVTANGAAILRYDALHVFDAKQATLPAYFSITESGIAINVDDSQAVYPITIDPLLTNQLMKRTASDAAASDQLGYDVNISQDIAVTGAYQDDNERGVDAGAAFLFEQNRGGFNKWGERIKLLASDGAAGDNFGKDVYVTFGVTVTVGAPGNDTKGVDAGAAYLYPRNQGGANAWGQLAKLTASDGVAGDAFGSAVSVQQHTVVVGAPAENSKGTGAGAVYIFDQPNPALPTGWQEVKKLLAPDGAAGDGFGTAVVVSGDLLFVGAPTDDDACPADPNCNSGSIYIFGRNVGGSNQWGLLRKRTASDASAGDLLGSSVNYALNVGEDRVIAGAPGDDEKGSNAGAAYVFDRNFGTPDSWSQRPKIMAPDGAADDQFGRAVGIGGNIGIIGSPFDDDSGSNSGSAYLVFFRWPAGIGPWANTIKILPTDGAANDHFGFSVDQRSGRIVIGTPMESDAGSAAGAAYFYQIPFNVGALQISNNVEPNAPSTNWNYTLEGALSHSEGVSGDGQTPPFMVFSNPYTVSVSAGANTDLSQYNSSWSCTFNGAPGASGSGTTLQVSVGVREQVVCNFTHRRAGTITIHNQTRPPGGTGFNFTDNIAAPNSFTLDDGGSHIFSNQTTGSYEVTEVVPAGWRLTGIICQDEDNGTLGTDNTATIDLDAGEGVSCTFSNKKKEGITAIKSADVAMAGVGQTITYSYRVINDSQDNLTNIVATDDKLGPVTLNKTTLAPNEEAIGTLQYTVLNSDPIGPLVNIVDVTGTPPAAPAVTDSTSASVMIVGIPDLAAIVIADKSAAKIEDAVTYSYVITNTGMATLSNVRAIDNRLGSVSLVDNSLQPGESTHGTLVYEVKESDLPGPLVDTVTISGTPPVGPEVVKEATVTVELITDAQDAQIELVVTPDTTSAAVGDTITYTYEIRNSGSVDLTEVTATDDRLGPVPIVATSLAPGESTTGTLTYTVSTNDSGALTNTVIARAKPPVGEEVESNATVSVSIIGVGEQTLKLPFISK